VVAHAFNSNTWEAEAGGFLSRGQPGLQSEFQDSQGYTEKPCLENNNNHNNNKIINKKSAEKYLHLPGQVSRSKRK